MSTRGGGGWASDFSGRIFRDFRRPFCGFLFPSFPRSLVPSFSPRRQFRVSIERTEIRLNFREIYIRFYSAGKIFVDESTCRARWKRERAVPFRDGYSRRFAEHGRRFSSM